MGEEIRCEQCGQMVSQLEHHMIHVGDSMMCVCGKHYRQYCSYHKFLDNSSYNPFTPNEHEITDKGVWIICKNRRGEFVNKFIIDQEDLEEVIKHKWRFARGNFCTGNTKTLQIHQFLMKPNDNQVVDHINGDKRDNRRCNLRVTTQAKNCINKAVPSNNTSGVMGVTWDKTRSRWAPEIKINHRKCHLGRYSKFEDAVYARYIAELLLFETYRSDRNDETVMKYVDMCTDKERIDSYVTNKLWQKHFLNFE